MAEITYAQAINDAISEEMRKDPEVFMMGEDIGEYCGAFGVSKGMIQEFGPERIMDTPIAEQGFVGAAIGAAMAGMRPIVELMFSDFMCVCYDELVNEAPKLRFMFGGKVSVPMVMRTPSGSGTGAAAQHSQSLEAVLAHMPGLKVVIPSTPYDAKGLLKTAIRDNNPVMFLEQKQLYRIKGEVPEEEYTIPLGQADIKREGSDVTLVTYGKMVRMCLETAKDLEKDGISAEVIDLRSLVPLDIDTVIASVKKTKHLIIVHEAVQFCGFGAEVAGQIADSEAFYYLDAPIKRLGAMSVPIPFNPTLEREVGPTKEKIINIVKDIL
ncbi:alpha-ketoacid dehydrogenase subunit beta [Christensenella timonensis]|uniref:alpha-ketoacid dehydrogenase subunit beta n=1 Tax=Christensenella timonensis TaxID=1816678 RepID=UPI0008309A18|nr:alpha-ketoacid dehydrogenase subunit beta [Christensenella timonensis]